jgi:8-oxo-dGTP diphosphatase
MNPEITKIYGNKIRIRTCGLCWQNGDLLMVNHRGVTGGDFWAPPGGGLEFGESVEACLKKEFSEETGLHIATDQFLFACEYIKKPLHAIELFFNVTIAGGVLKKGKDPEMDIIEDVRFISPLQIRKIPAKDLHGIFSLVQTPEDLKTLKGFFSI